MKRLLSLFTLVLAVGLGTVALEAEAAKRMGAGKSIGTQRQATPDKASTATPATAAAPAAGAVGAGAAAASPARSWMGPLAGIAAGLGIAALASHFGFGDALASMVMMGLLAAAIMVAIGFVLRKRAQAKQSSTAAPDGLRYAHVNAGAARNANRPDLDVPAYKVAMPPAAGSLIGSGMAANQVAGSSGAGRIPADFDSAGFARTAKVQFIRLQAAHDAADLNDIRQFTTPEMLAELQLDITERGTAVQKSDVLELKAEVTDVEEDAERYQVSVRFTGLMRDASDASEEAFDELWHLTKSRQGNSGWVLAGIQQMG